MTRSHCPARIVSLALAACAALALSGCNKASTSGSDTGQAADARPDVALPKPEVSGGSVTGMPSTPGPNPVGPALAAADDVPPASASVAAPMADTVDPAEVAVDEAAIANDNAPAVAMDAEPSVQDAVAVLQNYYAAINQRDFPRAWSSWSDGGRSSGQTAQQFADGFAGTSQVALTTGTPGRIEGAAGSRYIEIPVAIQATQRDGSVHRYTGTYTLRRAVVDGATDAQRAWHIGSAALHEVTR